LAHRRINVVKQRIMAIRQFTEHHPLHPVMIVFGILLAAGAAKSGHAMWAVGGMLAFYPIYLMSFVTARNGAALLARIDRLRLRPLR
jgi:hypothetical protein